MITGIIIGLSIMYGLVGLGIAIGSHHYYKTLGEPFTLKDKLVCLLAWPIASIMAARQMNADLEQSMKIREAMQMAMASYEQEQGGYTRH